MPIKLATEPNSFWTKRFEVSSTSNSDKSYVVAKNRNDEWACSCPHWIYRKKECKHIRMVHADQEIGGLKFVGHEIEPTNEPLALSRFALLEI